ncbi:MAG TPA: FixG Ig-like domain-containing protein, partial [Steroidobacteraceae bacterium]|nr:FixG Ig-like domain-containing protein [Steroidobacteraceae bacterium]
VQVDVLRDRKSLYRELSDGRIENVYTVHVINKDTVEHDFTLSVDELPNAVIDSERAVIHAAAADVTSVAVRIKAPALEHGGGHDIRVVVTAVDTSKLQAISKTRFFSPD